MQRGCCYVSGEGITMERLKQGIVQKLWLGPYQFAYSLLYWHLISLYPTQYQTCKLNDDNDIQLIWETNSQLLTQLSSVEIYVNIGSRELDFNTGNLPTNNHLLSLVYYTKHLCGSSGLTLLFNTYQIEDNTFTLGLMHIQQYDSLSIYHTSQPSSSKQPTSPPHVPCPA